MRENDKIINSETTCYRRFIGRAIHYRDAARESGITPAMRESRLDMMRTYARVAMMGGIKGSVWKK